MNENTRKAFRRALGAFLTGLLFLLPIILTIVILDWVSGYVASALGPDSLIGGALTSGGTALVGRERRVLGFIVALAMLIAAIAALGAIVQTRAKKRIEEALDRMIDHVPLLRSVYRPIAQLVRMLGPSEDNQLKAMRVIACRFGEERGADVLALLASTTPIMVEGEPRYVVYLPTAPFPGNGGLVMVPASGVRFLPELTVEDLVRTYVSFGTLVPPNSGPVLPVPSVGGVPKI